MLDKDTVLKIEDNITKLKNAPMVLGFYPSLIVKDSSATLKEGIEYLETIGVDKFDLKRKYILSDEDEVLVGKYDNVEDIPQDTYVENARGEEVYVGEDWYSTQYHFNR